DQQCDVSFANGAANVAVTHECFGLRKQIAGSGFGFEAFAENDAYLFLFANSGSAITTKPAQHNDQNVAQRRQRQANHDYFGQENYPIHSAWREPARLGQKTAKPLEKILDDTQQRVPATWSSGVLRPRQNTFEPELRLRFR